MDENKEIEKEVQAITEVAEKKKKRIPKSIRPEEFVRLIKNTPSSDYIARLGFLLGYGSGMRISEVMRCKGEHFQSNNSIFIPESKYGVERIVPVPKGWKENFTQQLPLLPHSKLNTAIRKLQRRFKKYKEKTGLSKYYSFHSLRHGFATRLLESGVPINQVQVLLGHSNISTTSVYTKANPIDALKSYEDLF